MPNVPGGYQPDTKSESSRRADFDLLRRISTIEHKPDPVIPPVPPMQAGRTTATTNASGIGAFSFIKFFGVTPVVVANVESAGAIGLIVVISGVTAGGFSARVTQPGGAAFVGSVTLAWIATVPGASW